MTIARFGTTIARLAGAALAGTALIAGVGCASFGVAATCTLQDGTVRVNGTARSYALRLECDTTQIARGRVDVQAGYDPASKQTKERISHPEGKVTSTWMCPDDPWLVANVRCERLGTSITSERHSAGLQQAINNMPQDRPYSAQKLIAGERSRLQNLLTDALMPKPAPAPQPPTAPAGPILFPKFIFPTVEQGDVGETVTSLQYLLRSRGFDVTVNGDFGDESAAAVRAFQRGHGLDADGVVRRLTWHKLAFELRQGDQGDAVRAAQSQLASRGLDVEVDGDFGPQTAEALRRYQRTAGLTVDGVVTLTTWAALLCGK